MRCDTQQKRYFVEFAKRWRRAVNSRKTLQTARIDAGCAIRRKSCCCLFLLLRPNSSDYRKDQTARGRGMPSLWAAPDGVAGGLCRGTRATFHQPPSSRGVPEKHPPPRRIGYRCISPPPIFQIWNDTSQFMPAVPNSDHWKQHAALAQRQSYCLVSSGLAVRIRHAAPPVVCLQPPGFIPFPPQCGVFTAPYIPVSSRRACLRDKGRVDTCTGVAEKRGWGQRGRKRGKL